MERKYTQETYSQIQNTIAEIEAEDIDWISEAISDLLGRFSEVIGWIKGENYVDNINEYHRIVLDNHNTTMEKVDSIFTAVEAEDNTYANYLINAVSGIEGYKAAIDSLAACVAGGISSIGAGDAVSNASNSIYAAFDPMLTNMEQQAMYKAAKEAVSDALSIGSDMLKYIKCMTTGDPVGAHSYLYAILNDTVAYFNDIGAEFIIPLTALTAGALGVVGLTDKDKYMNSRVDSLIQSKHDREIDGITDLVGEFKEDLADYETINLDDYDSKLGKEAAKINQDMYNFWDKVETVTEHTDAVSKIYKGYKGLTGNVDTLEDLLTGESSIGEIIIEKVFDDDNPYSTYKKIIDICEPIISGGNSTGEYVDPASGAISELSELYARAKDVDKIAKAITTISEDEKNLKQVMDEYYPGVVSDVTEDMAETAEAMIEKVESDRARVPNMIRPADTQPVVGKIGGIVRQSDTQPVVGKIGGIVRQSDTQQNVAEIAVEKIKDTGSNHNPGLGIIQRDVIEKIEEIAQPAGGVISNEEHQRIPGIGRIQDIFYDPIIMRFNP